MLVGSHSWWTFIALVCMLLYSLCTGIGLVLGFQLFSCSIAKSPGMCSVRVSSFWCSVLWLVGRVFWVAMLDWG